MYSSVDKKEALYDKWYNALSVMFLDLLSSHSSKYELDQISSSLWDIIYTKRVEVFFDELFNDDQIFIKDEWYIYTPSYLIDENEYNGSIRINMAGNESDICFEHFCAIVKFACFFLQFTY